MKTEIKIAHLGFVQNIISRMAQNSFILKGWCITLVAALFALSSSGASEKFVLITYIPIFMFWVLDGYFLYKEKCYRQLYFEIANDMQTSETFSLDASFNLKKDSMVKALFSKTVIPFYILMISLVLFIMFGVLK